MSEYYQELYHTHDEAHVRAGWRNRFEQVARYQIACEVLPQGMSAGRVLDVGCGPGDLFEHLRAQHLIEGDEAYLGIDRLELAVASARRRHPEARFERFDVLRSGSSELARGVHETVWAIGALISGERAGRRERVSDAVRLARWCVERSSRRGALICLRQEALDGRASLAAEEALFGLRAEELEALCELLERRCGVVTRLDLGVLSTDAALSWWRAAEERARAPIPSPRERAERACAFVDPDHADPLGRAWLWGEFGCVEEALSELSRCEALSNEVAQRAAILKARLEAM